MAPLTQVQPNGDILKETIPEDIKKDDDIDPIFQSHNRVSLKHDENHQ